MLQNDAYQAFISHLEPPVQAVFQALRQTLVAHLPQGFEESWSQNMLHYTVPHSLYPAGYHSNPKQALPFLSVAVQKNHIALYHMGLYADTAVLDWFKAFYAANVPTKLDLGKSCLRFKKDQPLPLDVIGTLCAKISVADWIRTYEANVKGL